MYGLSSCQRDRAPTKLLIGETLIVLGMVVLGVWAATQWAAYQLAYQAQLGLPWFALFGFRVYRPWQLFLWWFHYEAYAPAVLYRYGLLAASSGVVGCVTAVAGSLWRAHHPTGCFGAGPPLTYAALAYP